VPLLIRFPKGGLDVGVYDQPVATVDITPTLLSLAGYESGVQFEGRDLSEAFRGEQVASNQMVFLRNAGMSAEWVAAVDARYKLILSVTDRPWLFDSYEDPDELHNYYQRPNTRDITRRLARGLREYQKASNDPFLQDSKILESLKRCLD
jgi:arylsulfatase A-like enzyme